MATKRSVNCTSCKTTVPDKRTLFETLRSIAEEPNQSCQNCRSKTHVHLTFDFGLDVKDNECVIVAAFFPQDLESWPDKEGAEVTFYPFLVVLDRKGRERAIWLPYWHTVAKKSGKSKTKYGQWAPCMDSHLFESLLQQARICGLLNKV